MFGISSILEEHGYKLISEIGSGKFSHCYLCKSIKYELEFVAKVIPGCTDDIENVLEMEIQSKLAHTNIVNIYDKFIEFNYCVLILEYCNNGNLSSLFKISKELDPYGVQCIACQILDVLAFAHDEGMPHFGLNPNNIFVDKFNRVKISDFGIDQILSLNSTSYQHNRPFEYLAPEIFTNIPYYQGKTNSYEYDANKADIWAFGVILYQLVNEGKLPFPGPSFISMYSQIMKGEIELPEEIPLEIKTVIMHALDLNVQTRWSAKQLKDYLSSSPRSSPGIKTVRFSRSNRRSLPGNGLVAPPFHIQSVLRNKYRKNSV